MRKIYLSQTDKKLAGVCGGIAEAYELDATVVRLIAILLALVTHIIPTLFAYIVFALIIPKGPVTKPVSEHNHQDHAHHGHQH